MPSGRSRSNAKFSFNKVDKWPSLNENRVENEMAVQGIRGNGNNKLRRILVSIDESGKKRVDMDPLIEERSKSGSMTLVGYFHYKKKCF
ncbi:hypothetical protein Tco_0341784 [Tanacetum coccineum]